MKILFVALSYSIHTARWIKQLENTGWDIILYPCDDNHKLHDLLKEVKNLRFLKDKPLDIVIETEKPDLIHSMILQIAGIKTLKALEILKRRKIKIPKWFITNWGPDLHYFANQNEYRKDLLNVIKSADYYSAECLRDVKLAKDLGFKGHCFDVKPNTGGFNIDEIEKLRSAKAPSKRKMIMLKGYETYQGKCLNALKALEKCKDIFKTKEYYIHIYSSSGEIIDNAAKGFTSRTGIPVYIIPWDTPHKEMLRLHSNARVSIVINTTDGVCTSFLEALAMGSFPIQTDTACPNEWITDNKSGYIVKYNNIDQIADRIRNALTDDNLVDNAYKINWETTKNRLEYEKLRKHSISFYEKIFNDIRIDK